MLHRLNIRSTIRSLVVISLSLSLGDVACTAAGVSMGVVSEGNPLLCSFMNSRPILASLAAFAYTSGLLLVVYKLGLRCRFTVPLLAGLCVVKLAVMGMHLVWILSL